MRKISLLSVFVLFAAMSCTKTSNTTNNYTTVVSSPQPAFAINGISDLSFTNWFGVYGSLNLSVDYVDSTQESVTLSLSGLPAGIAVDTAWEKSGVPTFTTTISFFDTTLQGAAPGSYPVTLTAAAASGKLKTYQFSIRVLPMPTVFLGKYNSCFAFCDTTAVYTDSVYMDPVIANKIWFANYANSGHAVYGLVTLPGGLNIPNQAFGSATYSGSGNISPVHAIDISISGSCALNMR